MIRSSVGAARPAATAALDFKRLRRVVRRLLLLNCVIGGKPHTVRRADLGNRGIYYRAMVGPFASRDEAVSVCASLKQAGGDCVVQH